MLCKRLWRIVPVRTRGVLEEHIGRFELASRIYARALEKLPASLLSAVAIQPSVPAEFDAFVACSTWPKLRSLRIFDRPVTAVGTGTVLANNLLALPQLTQLESLSLWQTSELGDDVFDLIGRLTRLTSLQCSIMWRMSATSLRRLAPLPHLRSLHLEFCMSGAIGVVSCICDGRELVENVLALTQLRSIYVNSVAFVGPEIGALSSLTNLEELRLRDAAIHVPSSLTQLAELPNLHTLVLMFSRAPLQINHIIGMTRLRRLGLIGQFAASELAQLAKFRSLNALAMRRLEREDAIALCTVLREWSEPTVASLIDGGGGGGAASTTLAPMTAWRLQNLPRPELEEFSCWMAELDDANDLQFLEYLPASLRRLKLSLIEFRAPMDSVMTLARLNALEMLDLDQARLSDANMAQLIGALPSLRRLGMFGCELIGPLTLGAIGATCSELESFQFSRILHGTVNAVRTLAPLARCTRLSHLSLHLDRYIDEETLLTLQAVPQLYTLDLSECKAIAASALPMLARSLPNCRVSTSIVMSEFRESGKFKFFDE